MTTHSSPPSIPAGGTTITHTTPIWRLVGTAAAIAGVVAIGYHLALTELLAEFSVVVSSATAFLVQHVIFRDPETVRRLAGVLEPLAEVVVNLRRAAAHRRWTQLVVPALAYGVLVLLMQKGVMYAAGFFATWWVAAGTGLIVISLVVMPELWKAAGTTVSRLGPQPSVVTEDDELLALPSPAKPSPAKPSPARKVAARVRLTLPAGEVQADKLAGLASRGMADVEKFVAEFNARTAGREGLIRTVASIYDDGAFSFTVADEEG